MKKRAIQNVLLSILLILTLILSTSCGIIPVTTCTHQNVIKGDCKSFDSCATCGKQLSNYYGEHDYKETYFAGTCVNDAYTEYVCNVCGGTTVKTGESATGHKFGQWIFSIHPTETESGEKYRVCEVCQAKETESLPPHAHTMQNVGPKLATCTEDGWDAYEYCTDCGYSTREVKPALGHDWGEYTSIGGGMHSQTCNNDSAHVITEACSGGTMSAGALPVCDYCNSEYDIAVRAGNSTYGYYALGSYTDGEGMQCLYKDLIAAAELFYVSDEDVTADGNYYVIGEFDLNEYSLSEAAGMATWKVFYVSNPVYYWLDAMIVMRGDSLLLTIPEEYADADTRRANDEAIADMTAACDALIDDGMTELEKVVTITAFIVKGMEYAYESDGVTPESDMWAHSMAGLAMHGFGVCEAYAKSFMYLSLLHGVDCIMGSGYAGEPHAWNYVKIDGQWYGADITWTDNMGDEAVYDKFGLSHDSIFVDHFPHSSDVLGDEFIYAAPELSTEDIQLTALYKNGEYVGIYKSIDEAFANMTDVDAEYVIDLGYYSFYDSAINHSISATATPDVKKLTIVGKNEVVGEGYLDRNTTLIFNASLTLGSDLELANLNIKKADGAGEAEILLNGHTLTLAGNSTYLDTRVVGTDADSAVVVNVTGSYAVLSAGSEVYRFTVESGLAIFGADSSIVYYVGEIYTQNGADVTVTHKS